MRSYILSVLDPEKVDLSGYLVPVSADEAKLEEELGRIILPYIHWDPVLEAAEGDLAVCHLTSTVPRFQKDRLKVLIGAGLFEPVLENAVIGMRPGDEKTVILPEGKVQVSLMEVSRKVIPQPSDEMVSRLGLEGVAGVEDYREYLRSQMRLELAKNLSMQPLEHLIETVLEGSEFVLFKEDWETIVRQRLDRSRVLFLQEGIDIEKAGPSDFEHRIPVKSYYELAAMEQEDAWRRLCLYLLGAHWAKLDEFAPTEEDYVLFLKDYCKTWSTDEEMAKEVTPYDAFAVNELITHAIEHMKQIVVEQLLREE